MTAIYNSRQAITDLSISPVAGSAGFVLQYWNNDTQDWEDIAIAQLVGGYNNVYSAPDIATYPIAKIRVVAKHPTDTQLDSPPSLEFTTVAQSAQDGMDDLNVAYPYSEGDPNRVGIEASAGNIKRGFYAILVVNNANDEAIASEIMGYDFSNVNNLQGAFPQATPLARDFDQFRQIAPVEAASGKYFIVKIWGENESTVTPMQDFFPKYFAFQVP